MSTGREITTILPVSAGHMTRLPLLVEISLIVTQILIVVVAVITAVLSIMAHADTLTVILRTAIAIVGIGLPAYVLNYLFGRFFVEATLDDMKRGLAEVAEAKEQKIPGEMEIKI
ncbi:MAG TPA: hypothetical protein VF338_10870 [Leptolinea sp.]